MAKVYREVGITVGMGEYPTNFTSAIIDVMTENDIAKLLVEFPPRYDSYRKIVDIGYITASQVYTVMTYEMTYDDELEKFFFYINRRFTYGNIVYLQFRCLYSDGQESVDPAILRLKFRPALRTEDFASYENNDLETQSEILEKLVIQHANVNASEIFTGHVRVDGITIVITSSGVISAVVAPAPTINPLNLDLNVLGLVSESEFSLNTLCTSHPLEGISPYTYEWTFDSAPVITDQNAAYLFNSLTDSNEASLIVTDSETPVKKIFGGTGITYEGTTTMPINNADFATWIDINFTIAYVAPNDMFQVTLTSTTNGGTAPYIYEWYLGASITPVTTKDAYMEVIFTSLSDLSNLRLTYRVTDSEGASIYIAFALGVTT